jgi:hypothetical protein
MYVQPGSPGLLKAVCPGDVFTVKCMDPTGSAGYSLTTYLCVWVTHTRGADDIKIVEFGGLRLGRWELEKRTYRADLEVQFPWTRSHA